MRFWRIGGDKLSGEADARVAFRMLDMLGENPFVTPRGAEKHLGLAYRRTVNARIGQLEKYKIIKEVSGAKRSTGILRRRIIGQFS